MVAKTGEARENSPSSGSLVDQDDGKWHPVLPQIEGRGRNDSRRVDGEQLGEDREKEVERVKVVILVEDVLWGCKQDLVVKRESTRIQCLR